MLGSKTGNIGYKCFIVDTFVWNETVNQPCKANCDDLLRSLN